MPDRGPDRSASVAIALAERIVLGNVLDTVRDAIEEPEQPLQLIFPVQEFNLEQLLLLRFKPAA